MAAVVGRIVLFMSCLLVSFSFGRCATAFVPSLRRSCYRPLIQRFYMTSNNHNNSNLLTSTSSTTVKQFQSLLNKKKKRTLFQQTVVEGPRMIFDLLKNPHTAPLVQHVVVSTDQPQWISLLTEEYPHLQISEATPPVVAACSDTVTPQGIVATVSIPSPQNNIRTNTSENPLYLVLDGVSDPGNVGTLLRSSVAVGVAGVLLLPDCADVWNPKAVRSSMGSSFLLDIQQVSSLKQGWEWLDQHQVRDVYAATMDVEGGDSPSVPHYNVDWVTRPTALVIGKEGTGLSKQVRAALSENLAKATHVPMEAGIESLNAAVCGSVILFEYHRQCHSLKTT